MRVLTVIGRPSELPRVAALSAGLRDLCDEALIDAGVRHDDQLAKLLGEESGLGTPSRLKLPRGGKRTGAVMSALEPILGESRPDGLIVHGDSSAAMAAALVGAKAGVPVVRPEAGVRAFDKSLPEEVHRLVADSLAGVRLCPTDAALANLTREGTARDATVVGDLTLDAAALVDPLAERHSKVFAVLGLDPGRFSLAWIQRRSNLGSPQGLESLLALLSKVAAETAEPVVLPVPPRIHSRLDASGKRDELRRDGLALVERTGHLDTVRLLGGARVLISDSDELQREAFAASVPGITLGARTAWPETVETGWNRTTGPDPEAVLGALAELPAPAAQSPAETIYGGGGAGERAAAAIAAALA